MVASVIWGMSLEYTAATAAIDLVGTLISVGTVAFWSAKALTVPRLQEYNSCTFCDRLQVSVEMEPSVVLAD